MKGAVIEESCGKLQRSSTAPGTRHRTTSDRTCAHCRSSATVAHRLVNIMNKPTTVTLDTNVPLELSDKRDNIQDVEQLPCLAQKEEIDLAVTTLIRGDAPHDPWTSRLRKLLNAHGIAEIGSVTRLDLWVLILQW